MRRKNNQELAVLSGRFKGIHLQSPHSALTHPMGSREKLALFNMLQPHLESARVLDVYAGSGALGIEAFSRGAKEVFFVEKSPKIAEIIRQNIQQIAEKGHLQAILAPLPLEGCDTALSANLANLPEDAIFYHIFAIDASNFSDFWPVEGDFDVILADPPYDRFDKTEVAGVMRVLRQGGILALSFPYAEGTPELSGMELLIARKYAAAGIALYRKN